MGASALVCAARGGHTSVVRALLAADADVDNVKGPITPLMAASTAGGHCYCPSPAGGRHRCCVALLVARRRSPPTPPHHHTTIPPHPPTHPPTHARVPCSAAGFDAVCRVLIEKGADVNAKMLNTNWTPLMLAAHNGYLNVVQAS